MTSWNSYSPPACLTLKTLNCCLSINIKFEAVIIRWVDSQIKVKIGKKVQSESEVQTLAFEVFWKQEILGIVSIMSNATTQEKSTLSEKVDNHQPACIKQIDTATSRPDGVDEKCISTAANIRGMSDVIVTIGITKKTSCHRRWLTKM